MHVYDHNFQRSSLKLLGQSNDQILCVVSLERGAEICKLGFGDMIKMATIAICGKQNFN